MFVVYFPPLALILFVTLRLVNCSSTVIISPGTAWSYGRWRVSLGLKLGQFDGGRKSLRLRTVTLQFRSCAIPVVIDFFAHPFSSRKSTVKIKSFWFLLTNPNFTGPCGSSHCGMPSLPCSRVAPATMPRPLFISTSPTRSNRVSIQCFPLTDRNHFPLKDKNHMKSCVVSPLPSLIPLLRHVVQVVLRSRQDFSRCHGSQILRQLNNWVHYILESIWFVPLYICGFFYVWRFLMILLFVDCRKRIVSDSRITEKWLVCSPLLHPIGS